MGNELTGYLWGFEDVAATTSALAALSRATSPVFTLYRCFGELDDEGVFHSRDALEIHTVDVTDELDRFVRHCARTVVFAWDPDPLTLEFLDGNDDRRAVAHQAAWLRSATLIGTARAAARVAMYAADPQHQIHAVREAARLTLSILAVAAGHKIELIRTRLERTLGSHLLRAVATQLALQETAVAA